MNHWVVMPMLLPLVAGSVLLLAGRAGAFACRLFALTATAVLVAVCIGLFALAADGSYHVYALGQWPAPFGIVMVLDRLAAAMLLLTAVVALCSLLYAISGDDAAGQHFHALFQFQLLGINGAFLTGDLFNLFVFFEILLIASYALLMHGQGATRTRAAIQVVSLNLVGSALFLFGIGALYAVTGTLNLADLARLVPLLPETDVALARTAALLLLVVFGLKAAMLPLSFWLPQAYTVASAPVAALFAIMTKVGVYAIVRIYTLVFGADAGVLAGVATPWLLPIALATVVVGVAGALSARELRRLVAWLVIVSVGTLLAALHRFEVAGLAAMLFYTVHSTLAAAALFLLADLVRRQRTTAADRLDLGQAVRQPALLGSMFFIAAVSMASLPPLSGFPAKVMVLQAVQQTGAALAVWSVLLAGGLFVILGFARAASALFWNTGDDPPRGARAPVPAVFAVAVLLAAGPLLIIAGGPVITYANDTALQLRDTAGYRLAVLGDDAGDRFRRAYR